MNFPHPAAALSRYSVDKYGGDSGRNYVSQQGKYKFSEDRQPFSMYLVGELGIYELFVQIPSTKRLIKEPPIGSINLAELMSGRLKKDENERSPQYDDTHGDKEGAFSSGKAIFFVQVEGHYFHQ